MLKRRTFCGAAATIAAVPLISRAQPGPARVVIGFAPGGQGDVLARRLADMLRASGYATTAIVENKPGAGGRLALDLVKAAPPDGLTMLLGPASVMTILPNAYAKPPFDPFTDFAAAGAVSDMDFVFTVNAKLPVTSFQQYLELARRDPLAARYGTGGIGSGPHILGYLIGRETGTKIEHVPYRGGPAAFQDLMGEQIPATIAALSEPIVRNHKIGRLRVLATAGRKRSVFLPEVPTLQELGYAKLEMTDMNAVWVPGRTPAAQLERLSHTVRELAQDSTFLSKFSMEPLTLGPDALTRRLKAEHEVMRAYVKAIGFTITTP
ncbi:tripartite tricarboxylate transporter substrate-binding protein [Ottowia sp. VDI28]|uniref:tripartite tricarboxylate transporter substrate-binding protein n=1 Tax=Ottowia sp. VDI28 TaxID=3133968 RepID=UPI003C2F44FF